MDKEFIDDKDIERLYHRVGKEISKSCSEPLRGQGKILSILYNNDGILTQGRIQKEMEIKTGSISEMLAILVKKEFVIKTINPSDRRKALIQITELGRLHVEEYRKEHSKKNNKRKSPLDRLSDEEKIQLLELLKKLVE